MKTSEVMTRTASISLLSIGVSSIYAQIEHWLQCTRLIAYRRWALPRTHDVELHGKGGQNFGIVLSVWDWLFGTVYWPKDVDQPKKLGFEGMQRYPRGLIPRFAYPFYLVFSRTGSALPRKGSS